MYMINPLAFTLLPILASIGYLVWTELRSEPVRVYEFSEVTEGALSTKSYYLDARGRARCKVTNKFVKKGA